MSRPSSKPSLLLLLLTVLILVPLPSYIGIATSMAMGMTLAAALVVGICWTYGALSGAVPLYRTLDFVVRPALIVLLLSAVILAHSMVASQIQPMDLERCAASFVPLALLIVGGMTLGRELTTRSDAEVDHAAQASLWVFTGFVALKLARLEPLSNTWEKAMFPYTEVSHFALAFGPLMMYRCVRAKRSQVLWWLLFGFAVALSLQSTALLVCCFLTAAACRRILLISGIGMAILLGGLPLELTYFADRLNFSGAVQNLSNLVFIQGWEQVQESMRWSSGWGIGFQQMGFRETEVPVAQVIRFISSGLDINTTDGGFVFAKLASEFGVAGVLVSLLYLFTAARCLRALRRGRSRASITLARCIVVAYGVDMFARGTGYFVESTLLFVAALAALLASRKRSASARAVGNPMIDRLSPSL